MKRPESAFRFTPEMGRRLRDLRKRAGLSWAEVAKRMGRTGKGSGNIVGRLERAEVRYPSLGIVAD
ncbi:helix-turn-helix domain-containing protein, partial [candidate division WOR-3 bacterium]|nr:helix-turn-helix domain-containing protein [candidate division WOR-3 bacterium]